MAMETIQQPLLCHDMEHDVGNPWKYGTNRDGHG